MTAAMRTYHTWRCSITRSTIMHKGNQASTPQSTARKHCEGHVDPPTGPPLPSPPKVPTWPPTCTCPPLISSSSSSSHTAASYGSALMPAFHMQEWHSRSAARRKCWRSTAGGAGVWGEPALCERQADVEDDTAERQHRHEGSRHAEVA